MDTIKSKNSVELNNKVKDSIISVPNIKNSSNEFKSNEIKDSTIIAPAIIAALITSILGTLISQALDRYLKNNRENKKELREIHSKSLNSKIILSDLFRELAMYKFHTEYWWSMHTRTFYEKYNEKYYLEHLRSQSESRNILKNIGSEKAKFLSEVVKFEKLKGKKFNVDIQKKQIENLTFDKAKSYPVELTSDEIRNTHAENDEAELRNKYLDKLKPFSDILDIMHKSYT